jgi:PAS domain S-box-containing protein
LTTSAAQFQFAAEFVAFLAAAAGLALVVLGAELLTRVAWARFALAVGFAGLLGASFLHGSLLVDRSDATIAAIRAGGIVACAIGGLRWRDRVSWRLLWAGLAITAAAAVLIVTGPRAAADATLIAGSLVVGASLVVVSRRSIAARVAASAALTLLLMVLVLSVGLSAVLSQSTEREAVRRLSDTVSGQAERASDDGSRTILQNARYTAGLLYARVGQQLLQAKTADPRDPRADSATASVRSTLSALSGGIFAGTVGLAYVQPSGTVLAAVNLNDTAASEVSRSPVVRQTACPSEERATIAVLHGMAYAVGARPICTGANNQVGTVVAVTAFDTRYLDLVAGRNGPDLTLVGRTGVLSASTGEHPPADLLDRIGHEVIDSAGEVSRVADTRFVTGSPVLAGDQTPALAMIGSVPTSTVEHTRDTLFRTLFLIALGGTLAALMLAAFVGDRIGAGLRRLTSVAGAIRAGDMNIRANITSSDEVGVLGEAFDSMVASIEEKTTALQEAAGAEASLRNRLEAVVAGVGDALVAVDSAGRITDFNRAAEELTGVSEAVARGRALPDVLDLAGDDGTDLSRRAAVPKPSRWAALGDVAGSETARVPVAVSVGAVRGPGSELIGSVLVLRDLRREREVERMKTEFLSRVGHELRTPLTGIIGYSEMLLAREVAKERQRLWHEEILDASKRLLRIVEMLEFVASAGAGRMPLRPEPLDVRRMVEDLTSRWSTRVNGDHTIARRVSRQLPPVQADRRWLTLAVDELIDNAVKFSPDGGRVTVTAAPAAGNGEGIEISVVDRGVGMTAQEQAEAFGDFVQGDPSDTRRFGGLGLGLGLVKRVVEGHGGHVLCASEPNRGTRFTIFLPAAPAGDGARP